MHHRAWPMDLQSPWGGWPRPPLSQGCRSSLGKNDKFLWAAAQVRSDRLIARESSTQFSQSPVKLVPVPIRWHCLDRRTVPMIGPRSVTQLPTISAHLHSSSQPNSSKGSMPSAASTHALRLRSPCPRLPVKWLREQLLRSSSKKAHVSIPWAQRQFFLRMSSEGTSRGRPSRGRSCFFTQSTIPYCTRCAHGAL